LDSEANDLGREFDGKCSENNGSSELEPIKITEKFI